MEVDLHYLDEIHDEAVERLMKDPEVMQWIGDGKIYSDIKIKKFLDYTRLEYEQDDDLRTSFYYAIVVNDEEFAGIIGIHPVTYDQRMPDHPALTIYLDRKFQKQGIGYKAIAAITGLYWDTKHNSKFENIIIDVKTSNSQMLAFVERMGLERAERIYINSIPNYRYYLPK